jgi:hypothetical protein
LADLFVFGDGDRVRQAVDRFLLARDVSGLRVFSASMVAAISQMGEWAKTTLDADVLMAGGDDILFSCCEHKISVGVLAKLSSTFREATGCTMSFGVGLTLEVAYLNLRRAKSRGGGAVVGAD